MARASMEAPRCLTGAGRKSDEPMEIIARSEAGDDGRLQSRSPGAGAAEKAARVWPLASVVLASRLREAARVAFGGRLKVGDLSS